MIESLLHEGNMSAHPTTITYEILAGAYLPVLRELHVYLSSDAYRYEDGRGVTPYELITETARSHGKRGAVKVNITGPVELVNGFKMDRLESLLISQRAIQQVPTAERDDVSEDSEGQDNDFDALSPLV
jgi:hypothetical protein